MRLKTSSHLLLSEVKVEITPWSLANLDAVSRHPLVSKGIRIIKLFPGPLYNSGLAHDIQAFVAYHVAKLNQYIYNWESRIRWRIASDNIAPFEEALPKAQHLAELLEQIATNGIDKNDADHLMLLQAHKKYLELYEDHRKVSCSLTQAITSAMLRMPAAKFISISEVDKRGVPSLREVILQPEDLDQPESLLDYLVSPMSRFEARKHNIGPPPSHLISELLLSIQQLDIPLAGLRIATSPPVPWPSTVNTAVTACELEGFRNVAKRLKTFTFYPQSDELWHKRSPNEWTHLTSFLRVLLHTCSLERIHMDFYFMCISELPPLLSMGSLLLAHTWPNLKYLRFNGSFHLEELKAVVKPLHPSVRLEWSGYLMSGSWADVLDFLRERNAEKQGVGGVRGSTYGQECLRMSDSERLLIFAYKMSDILSLSMANRYIRGLLPRNPVVAWERGELDVPDLTDEDSEE
ncbi:hypothetical protein F5Y03DRAFT_303095 [Xylaria venustula]|nr:hypothetical protein F5Y03DRAFT_303095 [Xylaria venustula]